MWRAGKNNGLSQDAGIFAEPSPPQTFDDHDNRRRTRLVLLKKKTTPQQRTYSEDFQEIGGHARGIKSLRRIPAGECHLFNDSGECAQGRIATACGLHFLKSDRGYGL